MKIKKKIVIKIYSKNNYSEDEFKIMVNLININDNNSQNNDKKEKNKIDYLIKGDQKSEKEKSFIKKRKEKYNIDYSEKDFSWFEPSNIIEKESENDSIS